MRADDESRWLDDLRGPDTEARNRAEHELFEHYRGPVDRLLRRMLGRDTEDCVQEVFVDVFRGLRAFEGAARLSTWIYRVALRRAWKCAAAERRHRRGRGDDVDRLNDAVAPGAPHDVSAVVASEELARRFADALRELDIEQRTVVALSAIDGLGPAEIAEVLGVPVGTVHSRLGRARARLREVLGIEA